MLVTMLVAVPAALRLSSVTRCARPRMDATLCALLRMDAGRDVDEFRPGEVLKESAPDGPGQAISIMSELKANAALFSAFSFGSLNLPGTLTVSESKADVLRGISTTTSKPLPDSELLNAFVLLDVCTLCLMITCVAVSQLLIYRLVDGSYGTVRYSDGDAIDQRDTALGRLVTQYGSEFKVARASFVLGLGTLLLSVAVKCVAVFDASIAMPVVSAIGVAALTISVSYVRSYTQIFRPLEEDRSWLGAAFFFAPALFFLAGLLTFFSHTTRLFEDGQVAAAISGASTVSTAVAESLN